jgi:hypothetical protein
MENSNDVVINEKSNNKNKANLIICIIIALIIGGCCGFFISQFMTSNSELNKNEENKNENKKDNDDSDSILNKISGKHKFSEYCNNASSCKKDIGIISINNQELKLSIDLNNTNTESVSGNISLGSNTKNLSDLSYFSMEKSFDGFEIYENYLIIYSSNLHKEEHANCQELEGLRGYHMYILDSNLNETSGLSGFTLNDAYTDIKIENDFVYYYGELNTGDAVVYDKIEFDDLVNKDWDKSVTISKVKECK